MQTASHVVNRKLKKLAGKANGKLNGDLTGKLKNTLGAIQEFVGNQPNLKDNLKEVIDTEKHIFDQGVRQITSLTKYAKMNWKTVVPALAALGIGAYFLSSPAKSK